MARAIPNIDRKVTVDDLCGIGTQHVIFSRLLLGHSIHCFDDLPIIEKSDLLQVLAEAPRSLFKNAYVSSSGATGGIPIFFPVLLSENIQYREMFVKHLLKAGILHSNQTYLNAFICGNVYRSLEIFDDFARIAGASVFSITTKATNEELLRNITLYHCTSLFGTSRRLTDFGLFVKRQTLCIHLDTILFAAEPLQRSKRKLLEEVFQTKRIFGVYGSSETGVWAYQSEECCGTNKYYCHDDMVHLEVRRSMDDEIDGGDDVGDLIVSCFVRTTKMPTIRFRMGDIGRILSHDKENGKILFELLKRSGKEFLFATGIFSVEDVENALSPDVLEWKIKMKVDSEETTEILEVYVAGEKPIDCAVISSALDHTIRTNPAVTTNLFKVEVIQCTMKAFTLSVVGKIIRVLDHRQ